MAHLDKTTLLTFNGRLIQFICMTEEIESWLPKRIAAGRQPLKDEEQRYEGKLQSTQDKA